MMQQLLLQKARRLTDDQWQLVMDRVSVEPTALYMRLALRVAEQWRSSQPPSELQLTPSVRGLVHQILDGMEALYGCKLVRTALALITYSCAGVSDTEMEDLVSLDEEVLGEVFQYHSPTTRRLPSHVWMRVREALAGLVVERDHGCVAWYHRQLQETAETRYADERRRAHRLMGRYFGDLVRDDERRSKKVSSQPLVLNGAMVWFDAAKVNVRRCVEAVHHLLERACGWRRRPSCAGWRASAACARAERASTWFGTS